MLHTDVHNEQYQYNCSLSRIVVTAAHVVNTADGQGLDYSQTSPRRTTNRVKPEDSNGIQKAH